MQSAMTILLAIEWIDYLMELTLAPFVIGAIIVGVIHLKKKDTQNGVTAFYTATVLCGLAFANRFVEIYHGGSYYGSDFE